MQFSDILAASIHDIKNSLGMLMATLDNLSSNPKNHFEHPEQVIRLQEETKRANNDLIQLLLLYKYENGRLGLNVNELNIEEFLEDIQIENCSQLQARKISLKIACDPDLFGYFDDDLVKGVINSAIGNASRYTQSQILLSGYEDEGYLIISVEDDGSGFPISMLEAQETEQNKGSFSSGSTQLGLYFAQQVASIHENRGKRGCIRLENNRNLTGGCFSIQLP
ncbi:MAG: HAMP domain-containing histidine kinase [Candidatus Polarisedimenticolaceae bacterium]|nr:HAMP domain-containing histidine kinase [Candidatus Polarisedimenticolaceae bacterium]